MHRIGIVVAGAVLTACAAADDEREPSLNETAQPACVPTPGGSCPPIWIDGIRPYACLGPHGGDLVVGNRSTVLVLDESKLELDRVTSDGTVFYDVNPSLPYKPRRIYRSTSGKVFVAGQRPPPDGMQAPTRLEVHEVSATTGEHVAAVVDVPIPTTFNAFAVDQNNRFYVSWGSSPPAGIHRLAGSQFVLHADTGAGWSPYHLAFASDNASLFGWTLDKHLWRYTPGAPPIDLGSDFGVISSPAASIAVDRHGRVYLARKYGPGSLSRIYRFEPDGSGQVIFAEGTPTTTRIAYDHGTHELVTYSVVDVSPCPPGVYGVLRRIPL